jgi:hypothetical protein
MNMSSQQEVTFDNIFNNKIEDIKSSFEKLRNNEFEKIDFGYKEIQIIKKDINVDTKDFKNFQSTIRKKALMEKNKPSNIFKKDVDTTDNDKINIIDDPIFSSHEVNEEVIEEKIDISILNREEKLLLIHNYLKKKSIKLDEENMLKIENIIDNPDIILRKYITISKMYQDISKISFIRKIDETNYAVILEDSKSKKAKSVSFFK